ncbi:hypothetical protein [Actinoplanes sp. L3-i22]|uniref:hypothetical protein n=1 Tax=Actinoplanes sp. L3-i22 TaxID=2836373 RepID=UPI001C788128|nr:hypothetical protein [Actinoplanes sp. L3-i22]BCY07907.1 hypothetical protein L3i22_029950 [Actinoplanes sp. L3-i22]
MTVLRALMAVATVLTCTAAPAQAAPPPPAPRLAPAERAMLLDATRRFRDVREAVRAGYLPTRDCVPGMGLHYANPTRSADPRIDPLRPEILLYLAGPHGTVRLAGLEYYRVDTDGDLRTDGDRPDLLGHPFNGPMLGHPVPVGAPAMPVHYDLHVWLYEHNPAGELATENPRVVCR